MSSIGSGANNPVFAVDPTPNYLQASLERLQNTFAEVADCQQLIHRLLAELKDLVGNVPEHPGKNAGEAAVKKYNDSLAKWQDQLNTLCGSLLRVQARLVQLGRQASDISTSDLPKAAQRQRDDTMRQCEELRKHIETQLKAIDQGNFDEIQQLPPDKRDEKVRLKAKSIQCPVELGEDPSLREIIHAWILVTSGLPPGCGVAVATSESDRAVGNVRPAGRSLPDPQLGSA